MKLLTPWVVRYAGWVSLISILLALLGAYFTVQLYMNLRTDMEELLPKTARSVVDLNEVTGRLESTTNLAVLVFSKHPSASKRFVADLAQAVKQVHSPLVNRIEYKIDEELRFFGQRRALFVDVPDLLRIRNYIRKRLDYERSLYNPLNIFSIDAGLREPKLDFGKLTHKYSSRLTSFTKFKDGYYATRTQDVRVLLVYLSGKASGLNAAKELRKLLDGSVSRLNPRSYAPDLTVKYTGDIENLVEEQESLVADLELSVVLVAVLVSLAMMVFYRDILATAALLGSLFVGTLMTFGIAYFAVGYLNANTAFLGSIVIGNGINFGIIVLARYMEERRSGVALEGALETATNRTLSPTLTAALAAGLSYGSLVVTSFRGFKQFGVIGLIGMVLCWLTAFTTMPAFLAMGERWRLSRGKKGRYRVSSHRFAGVVAFLIVRAPRLWIAIAIGLLAWSCLGVISFKGQLLETDMTRLRDRTSMTRGSGFLAHYLDEIFERYVSPLVVMGDNRKDAQAIAHAVAEQKKREGSSSLIAAVYTLDDFVPAQQAEKIRILDEIRTALRPRIYRQLSGADKRRVSQFLAPQAFIPFGVEDLPKQIQARFREKDGRMGNLVLVEPVFNEAVLGDAVNQERLIRTLRKVVDAVRPGTPLVGQLPLTVDMYQSIRRDGPRATLIAFVAVLILVTLLFRNVRTILLVLSTLLLGVSWLAGIVFHWDLKINFLNFIALPITFGIGVDYGVNIVQRYRSEGRGSVLNVVRHTGGAVALASSTTIIGYGSLLLAGNQGFVSFGKIAILGEFTCLGAAILVLPAFLHYRDLRARKRPVETAAIQENRKAA